MARKSKSRASREPAPEEIGLDEVDQFAAEKEEILLDEAGWTNNNNNDEEDESEEEQEVMAIDEEDDEDDSQEEIERIEKKLRGPVLDEEDEQYFGGDSDEEMNEEDDEEGWGASAKDYYGAEEDEDEDLKATEQEALRIQKKHLEELGMDDYMIDEAEEEWALESKAKEQDKELQSKDVDIATLDSESQLQILQNNYPEFIPLTKESKELKSLLAELAPKKDESELVNLKISALSSYLGTIGTYFALFLSNLQSGEKFTMKDDPIMASILSAREMWRQAKNLPYELPEISDVESGESDAETKELNIMDDAQSDDSDDEEQQEDISEDEQEPEENDEELDYTTKRKVKKLKSKGFEEIDEIDNEDKKGRRKTLRFYTSKIDQQENKKDARFQGDQDLPYKERLFERQQRLLEEARKRGDRNNTSAPGADLDDNDDYRDDDNNVEGSDYYDSLKSSKLGKKKARKEAHSLAVKAARDGKLAELEETLGDDGKRAINYQILKNKGLTPHRKKDNRNARVKKRKKYAAAQKKLKSVRAVYQTPSGPYAGESTGIKKNLSKSVKLR
ncbi:unnamed protein product [Ambrosiozyma monospora]|uniref:Unnamed protein product n=1 Tax=Ambrosiozyma monospora TaxID=43982 RepID=A0A9W6YVK4_AMBMO|nr:unnamed protein product [Ambrosiozyma monospora]